MRDCIVHKREFYEIVYPKSVYNITDPFFADLNNPFHAFPIDLGSRVPNEWEPGLSPADLAF